MRQVTFGADQATVTQIIKLPPWALANIGFNQSTTEVRDADRAASTAP